MSQIRWEARQLCHYVPIYNNRSYINIEYKPSLYFRTPCVRDVTLTLSQIDPINQSLALAPLPRNTCKPIRRNQLLVSVSSFILYTSVCQTTSLEISGKLYLVRQTPTPTPASTASSRPSSTSRDTTKHARQTAATASSPVHFFGGEALVERLKVC